MIPNRLLERYYSIEDEIQLACSRAGRKRDKVRLLAVSKFQTASAIKVLAEADQFYYGENYVQEALAKRRELSKEPFAPCLCWDMIGHIQTRKASLVAGAFNLIQTLDSLKLALALEKHLEQRNITQDVLIEVNIGMEPQKAGVYPDALFDLAASIKAQTPHLNLRGLMCLPPVLDSGEQARPYFVRLRGLKERLEAQMGHFLPDLSMGMSGDFGVAIEEGATIVRIGTAIFGPRPTLQKESLASSGE